MAGMAEREEKRSGWCCAIGLVLLLVLLVLVAYILSTGPFTWLVERGYMSQETAEATAHILYAPFALDDEAM